MKKRTLKLIILFSLMFILGSVLYVKWQENNLKKDPQSYLLASDKDNVYERLLILKEDSDLNFDSLLLELISPKNTDMLVQNSAIRYIKENEKREFLPDLIKLQNFYSKLNQDSIWYTKVNKKRSRANSLRDSELIYYLDKTIELFANN